MKSDYKIASYYRPREPDIERFKVISGGSVLSIYKTYEEAAKAVSELAKDPWYLSRGQTRADRNKP